MNKYQEYAQLQKQIDDLSAQQDAIKVLIQAELPEEGHKDEFVTVSWRVNKKWTYSDTIKTLETKLKEDKTKIETQKEIEEKDGTATAEESKSLVIKVK